MKKYYSFLVLLGVSLTLFACKNTISVGGVSYDESLVKSGYNLDKASLSDAKFVTELSNVREIERPKDLGKVVLPDLSTIEITDTKAEEITDAMVEAELEKERDAETTYSPIKTRREAQLKDKVIIDFKGFQDGVAFEGGEANDYELVLGSGQFIPGFEEQLVGHYAGRKFNIDVTFPEEYSEPLAGKPATFEISIKSIEEPTLPEVNSEFVVRHTKTGAFNVDEYKEELKERLKERDEFYNNQNVIYQVSDKLFTESTFEPTEIALAWQFSLMLDSYNKQAEQSGMSLAQMIAQTGLSVNDFFKELKSYVPESVKSPMLTDELQKKYKLTVSDDDTKKWFENIASAYGYGNDVTYDQYVEYVGIDTLKDIVLQEKLFLKAAESCKHVESVAEE